MNYRTARANWTPIDWGAFCKQTLVDANRDYRRQLLSQATNEDLSVIYRDLMKRRNTCGPREAAAIEGQLCDIDREFAIRTET